MLSPFSGYTLQPPPTEHGDTVVIRQVCFLQHHYAVS